MSKLIRQSIGWRTTTSDTVNGSGGNGFTPGSTLWLPAGNVKSVRSRTRIQSVINEIQARPALQLWNNRDATTGEDRELFTIGSFSNTVGAAGPTSWETSIASSAANWQWMRLGWESENSTGSNLSSMSMQTDFEFEVYENRNLVSLPWRWLLTSSTSQQFYPVTQWLDATMAEKVRGVLELRNRGTDFEAQIGYQLTNDTETPATTSAIGSAITAEGVTFPEGFSSPSTAYLYIRFGWLIRLTSAGTAGCSLNAMLEMLRD